jgi:prephenate dehydrogenase
VIKLADLDFNITVVGLGLIGGSLAMALKQLNPKNLWGVDKDLNVIEAAENTKVIDKGFSDAETPLKNSDIVIIALYPALTKKFIKDNLENFKMGAIITDTSGIKEDLVKEVNSFIPDHLDFIGGHPMAGKEQNGFNHASKDIFIGANYILTPSEKNKAKNIGILESILSQIGFKNIVRIDPGLHDQIIAFTSQLPHIIAMSLVNSDIPGVKTSSFIGGSFKDATRVAKTNSKLWMELFSSNSQNLVDVINTFEENIKVIKKALIENDHFLLMSQMEKANLRQEVMM